MDNLQNDNTKENIQDDVTEKTLNDNQSNAGSEDLIDEKDIHSYLDSAKSHIESKKSDSSDDEKENYWSYYLFLFVSSIIGFVVVLFLTRFAIDKVTESGNNIFLLNSKFVISLIVALIAVIIFLFISITQKKVLKKVFLSEIFLYLYVGTLTTAVNFISFELIRRNLSPAGNRDDIAWKVAEIIAFIIATIFAFVGNKFFVFKSPFINPIKMFSEFGVFIGARVVTELINIAIMWFMIDKNNIDESLSKVVASVVVIVSNYFFSKLIIFKKNIEKNDGTI